MAEDSVRGSLAAILAADVVGYSYMMSVDEVGTLSRLMSLRRESFDPRTKQNGGRIFKTTGDGAFVEFKSAVGAVKSVVDIQKAVVAATQEPPKIRKFYSAWASASAMPSSRAAISMAPA